MLKKQGALQTKRQIHHLNKSAKTIIQNHGLKLIFQIKRNSDILIESFLLQTINVTAKGNTWKIYVRIYIKILILVLKILRIHTK